MTNRVDGPPAIPGLGHLLAFHRDTTGFLARTARRYGDVARFWLGRRPAYLFSHPDHVRRILIEDGARFGRGRLMERAKPLLGDGLLTSEGNLHRRQRRVVMAALSRDRAARYVDVLPAILDRAQSRWRAGSVVDLVAEMETVALELIATALFGAESDSDLAAARSDLEYLNRWAPLLLAPVLGRLDLGPMRRARLARARLNATIERGIRSADGRRDPSILRSLTEGGDMCPALVRDEAVGLFLAGHDTTAASLGWTWFLLSTHPTVERRLHAELDSVLGERAPTIDDLERLPYLQAVIAEVLRLYPPISRIGRRPTAEYSIAGLRVPCGAAIFVSPYVTQRDSRWFPDPDRFDPTRWSGGARRPRWAYFPFGAGPRACVGEHLARLTLGLTVATIARYWRFRPTTAHPPVSRFLTLKLRRLPVRAALRLPVGDRLLHQAHELVDLGEVEPTDHGDEVMVNVNPDDVAARA